MNTDEISLLEAMGYTTAWRNAYGADPKMPMSFLVPLQDLQGVLNEMGSDYCRIYLGLDADGYGKLVLVGADSREKDLLNTADPSSTDSGCWDFSRPCPPVCNDQDSPLASGEL